MANLDFTGEVVAVILENAGVRLLLIPEGEISLAAQVIVINESERFNFSPGQPTERLSHIYSRLAQTVHGGSSDGRSIEMRFEDAFTWVCAPSDDYESWAVSTRSGRWVSSAGGATVAFTIS